MFSNKCTVLLLLFLSVTVHQCNRDFHSLSSKPAGTQSYNLTIQPTQGVIGTRVKLSGVHFDLPAWQNIIMFSNIGDFIRADSGSADAIFAYVPYCAQNGKVELQNSSGSYFVNDFGVIENCQNEVNLSWSNLNYIITAEMSTLSPIPGIFKSWSVDSLQDTIRITGQYFPGDFSVTQRLNLLNRGANHLPEFLSGYAIYYPDYPDSTIFPLDKGLIKIQDWDLDNRISGRVLSTPWNYNEYIFWYDFNK